LYKKRKTIPKDGLSTEDAVVVYAAAVPCCQMILPDRFVDVLSTAFFEVFDLVIQICALHKK
jgi:hypothetical protein